MVQFLFFHISVILIFPKSNRPGIKPYIYPFIIVLITIFFLFKFYFLCHYIYFYYLFLSNFFLCIYSNFLLSPPIFSIFFFLTDLRHMFNPLTLWIFYFFFIQILFFSFIPYIYINFNFFISNRFALYLKSFTSWII